MSKKLRNLHFISNSCDHPYLNGLIENIESNEIEVFVGSLEPRGELHKHFESIGIPSFSLDARTRINYPMAILKLARWLRKNDVDIIQTHLFDASVVGLLAAFLARTKIRILTGHHSSEVQYYKGKPTFWLDVIAARYLSTNIIAPSEKMREVFVEVEGVSPDKISVIRHGFDQAAVTIASKTADVADFWPNDGVRFLAIGRISWIKCYDGLLRAFREARDSEPNICLVIVGGGDATELEQLAQTLDINESVKFAGWRSDVVSLLDMADIFVHNAVAESFGMVVIEAMMAGKPVISTSVGIAAEVIENGRNGYLVPVQSVAALGDAMIDLSRSKNEWSKMGENNRGIAGEFTSKKMASEHQAAYSRWYSEALRSN